MNINRLVFKKTWVATFTSLMLTMSGCAQSESSIKKPQANQQSNQACELDNKDLQAMPVVNVSFRQKDGSVYSSEARLAKNYQTRAAGFQRVCASTIAAMPILFVFDREGFPQFHMNNVVAAIDIAFIDKRGRIESIQAMKPYSLLSLNKPTYGPNRPVISAFEAHPDFFKDHGISLDSLFTWSTKAQK